MQRSLPSLVGAALLAGCSPSSEELQLQGGEPEHPGGAIYRWQQRLSEDGTIPHNAVVNGKIQRDSVIRRANVEDAPPLLGDWTWRGPGNIGGPLSGMAHG